MSSQKRYDVADHHTVPRRAPRVTGAVRTCLSFCASSTASACVWYACVTHPARHMTAESVLVPAAQQQHGRRLPPRCILHSRSATAHVGAGCGARNGVNIRVQFKFECQKHVDFLVRMKWSSQYIPNTYYGSSLV